MRYVRRQLKSVFVFGSAILLLSILAGGPTLSASDQAEGTSWLDQPLANWNKPGGAIPKPPSKISRDEISRCHAVLRKPGTPEERAIAKAGWMLLYQPQTLSGTTIVMGQSGFDGMCRPAGFQLFVFVHGRFAGTLSPAPMDSRDDGTLDEAPLKSSNSLEASFRRYGVSDALCCPSGVSLVTFEIVLDASNPLVTPKNVSTRPISPPK